MFNIGGWELVFIALLVLLLWKPEELEERARQLGRWWARLTRSPWWQEMHRLRSRAEEFLQEAAREANVEDAQRIFAETGRVLAEPGEASRGSQPWAPAPSVAYTPTQDPAPRPETSVASAASAEGEDPVAGSDSPEHLEAGGDAGAGTESLVSSPGEAAAPSLDAAASAASLDRAPDAASPSTPAPDPNAP